MYKCYCGRVFTTVFGSNAHKKLCHIFDVSEISDLITETVEENNPESEVEIDIETLPRIYLNQELNFRKMTWNGSKQMISLEIIYMVF